MEALPANRKSFFQINIMSTGFSMRRPGKIKLFHLGTYTSHPNCHILSLGILLKTGQCALNLTISTFFYVSSAFSGNTSLQLVLFLATFEIFAWRLLLWCNSMLVFFSAHWQQCTSLLNIILHIVFGMQSFFHLARAFQKLRFICFIIACTFVWGSGFYLKGGSCEVWD